MFTLLNDHMNFSISTLNKNIFSSDLGNKIQFLFVDFNFSPDGSEGLVISTDNFRSK